LQTARRQSDDCCHSFLNLNKRGGLSTDFGTSSLEQQKDSQVHLRKETTLPAYPVFGVRA
jgi:hypothetical protein